MRVITESKSAVRYTKKFWLSLREAIVSLFREKMHKGLPFKIESGHFCLGNLF